MLALPPPVLQLRRPRPPAPVYNDPVPPPPTPVDASIIAVFLSAGGDLLIMFDGPVNIDHGNPPATWTFGGVGLAPGGVDFVAATEVVPNGVVNVGDTAVIGGGDPAARTPSGGFVIGGTFGVASG